LLTGQAVRADRPAHRGEPNLIRPTPVVRRNCAACRWMEGGARPAPTGNLDRLTHS